MEDYKRKFDRIQVNYLAPGEAQAKYFERIRNCERRYEMSSEEMEKLYSTGDEHWDTVEILKWMSAHHAYQSLSEKETPTAGTASKTTETSTTIFRSSTSI